VALASTTSPARLEGEGVWEERGGERRGKGGEGEEGEDKEETFSMFGGGH